MPPEPPTHPEEIVIRSSTGLKDHSVGDSPVGTVPERRAGEEQEFEIAPGVKIVMCWIPPGEFLMGVPQRLVTFTHGFWLGKYEVTQVEWQVVMGSNPSRIKCSNLPVESVSWDDISEPSGFLDKANSYSTAGWLFVLPTEAQWEYACRAGTVTSFNNGEDLTHRYGPCTNLEEVAWYRDNSGGKTHPVGVKKANAWGLHDMHGNVWEWCSDSDGDCTRRRVPDSYRRRRGFPGLRGGGWDDYAYGCRAEHRDSCNSGDKNNAIGFRVARTSAP